MNNIIKDIEKIYNKTFSKLLHFFLQLNDNTIQKDDNPKIYNKLSGKRYLHVDKYLKTISSESAIDYMTSLFETTEWYFKTKERLNVGFVVHTSSEWQCDEIYNILNNDERFDLSIFLAGYGKKISRRKTVKEMQAYFSEKKYKNVINIYNHPIRAFKNLDDCNLIVYMIPYASLHPIITNFLYRRVDQLIILLPYGIMQADRRSAYYKMDYLYDTPIYKMCWKYFSSSRIEQRLIEQDSFMKGYNTVFLGFPKIDALINKTYHKRLVLWKNNENVKKRIIWAPHFNQKDGANGTFFENYVWFYEYAKSRTDISWVVRPHPRMAAGTISAGIFHDRKEYDEYIKAWNELENAQVIEGGDYYDIFDTSDAMILDSISFVAEYFFTGKPLLILESNSNRGFNELGVALRQSTYHIRGNDFKGLEQFVDSLIETDPKKKERDEVLKKYLNQNDSISVSKAICDTIFDKLCIK